MSLYNAFTSSIAKARNPADTTGAADNCREGPKGNTELMESSATLGWTLDFQPAFMCTVGIGMASLSISECISVSFSASPARILISAGLLLADSSGSGMRSILGYKVLYVLLIRCRGFPGWTRSTLQNTMARKAAPAWCPATRRCCGSSPDPARQPLERCSLLLHWWSLRFVMGGAGGRDTDLVRRWEKFGLLREQDSSRNCNMWPG